jgi:hypothetical protein
MLVQTRRLVAEIVGQIDHDGVANGGSDGRPRPTAIDANDGPADATRGSLYPVCLPVVLNHLGRGRYDKGEDGEELESAEHCGGVTSASTNVSAMVKRTDNENENENMAVRA